MSEPYYSDDAVTLYHGDCLDVLAEMPDASVDAIVTDPPYGLEFMGKEWDAPWKRGDDINADAGMSETGYTDGGVRLPRPTFTGSTNPKCQTCGGTRRGRRDGTAKVKVCLCDDGGRFPNVRAAEMLAFQMWCQEWTTEALRVLKPGGHLLAFGGSRTWHRLAVAVEDAGFEVRDSIAWLYGSGFPKSLDVSKAIDKARDDRDDILRVTAEIARLRDEGGLTNRALDDLFGFAGMAGHWTSTKSQPAVPTVEQWAVLREALSPDQWLDAEVWRLNGRKGTPGEAWQGAEVVGVDTRYHEPSGIVNIGQGERHLVDREIKAPATPAAQQWQGWGTALKPAFEPVVVARKPLEGTVAANVLAHGVGGLNIDAARIGRADGDRTEYGRDRHLPHANTTESLGKFAEVTPYIPAEGGRWPANVILDESQAATLDEQTGELHSQATDNSARSQVTGATSFGSAKKERISYGKQTGGASRFFYVAKAPKSERPVVDGTAHPTVKPLTLMRYLVKLVTPPGGVVLDTFAGSGATLEAARLEGFDCIGIEQEERYLPLVTHRLERVAQATGASSIDLEQVVQDALDFGDAS